MKLINPSVELIVQEEGLEGIYKQIEKVARTCYKSEDKITEDSAKPFVERMINSQHYAMLEHGTVYLSIPVEKATIITINRYVANNYSKVVYRDSTAVAVTTNYRVIIENGWQDDLKYLCEPTECHCSRICLKFITSIGVSREFNRHRVSSVAEQSTRYCNYNKEKFGSKIIFVKPAWSELPIGIYSIAEGYPKGYDECSFVDRRYINYLMDVEYFYLDYIKSGWKPQQAREVLPLATATEVVYTALEEDWRHFFDLRYRGTTGAPHPNAFQVASMAHELIKEKLGKDL